MAEGERSRCRCPACRRCGPYRHRCRRQNPCRTMAVAARCRRRDRRGHFCCAHHRGLPLTPTENYLRHQGPACLAVVEQCRSQCRKENFFCCHQIRCLPIRRDRQPAEEQRWAIRLRARCFFLPQRPGFRAEAAQCLPIRRREIQCAHGFRSQVASRVEGESLVIHRSLSRCRVLRPDLERTEEEERRWKPIPKASGHPLARLFHPPMVVEQQSEASHFPGNRPGRQQSQKRSGAEAQRSRCRRKNRQRGSRSFAPSFAAWAAEK